ncbi:MAG TPA: hypothetical protein PKD63_00375 [Solirubrobacteraceae bacterium]|nr:hypothetical protein [Solirubrobacteraceae bacterium]
MLTLKSSVPGNWTAADHQSLQPASFQPPARQRPVRRHWTNDAVVKNREPIA